MRKLFIELNAQDYLTDEDISLELRTIFKYSKVIDFRDIGARLTDIHASDSLVSIEIDLDGPEEPETSVRERETITSFSSKFEKISESFQGFRILNGLFEGAN